MELKVNLIEIMAAALNQDRSGWSDIDWEKQSLMHKEDLRGHSSACLKALDKAGYEVVKIEHKND